jgi:hypothetical protein
MNRETIIQNFMMGSNPEKFKKLAKGVNGVVWEIPGNKNALIKQSLRSNNTNFEKEYTITKEVYNTLKRKGENIFVPEILSNMQTSRNNNGKVTKLMYMLRRVPGVTLNAFVKQKTTTHADIRQVKRLCHDHIKTLKSIGIVHGDLHTGNIMVDKSPNGSIKVYFIDFGRARRTTNKISNETYYHNIVTSLGCTPGTNRMCALPYSRGVLNKKGKLVSRLTARSNEEVINSLFPSNFNPIVSYNRRVKNLENLYLNVVESINTNLFKELEKYYPNGTPQHQILSRKRNVYMNKKNSKEKRTQEQLLENSNKIEQFLNEMRFLNQQKRFMMPKSPTIAQVGAFMRKLTQPETPVKNKFSR